MPFFHLRPNLRNDADACLPASGGGIGRTLEETSEQGGNKSAKTMRRSLRRRTSAVMLEVPSILTLDRSSDQVCTPLDGAPVSHEVGPASKPSEARPRMNWNDHRFQLETRCWSRHR